MSSSVLDDDDDGAGGLPLELDVDLPHAAAPAAAATAPKAAPAVAGAAPAALLPLRSTPPEPSVAEVAALAGYGAAPTSLLLAPTYAARVFLRRRQLMTEVRAKRASLAEAELAADEQLSAAMEQVRAAAGPEHPLREMFESLSGHDAVAEAASGALEDVKRRAEDAEARRAQQVAGLGEERSKLEAALAEVESAAAALREVHARAEGRLKRAEIEVRAAHDAARIAAGPDAKFAPPEHAMKIKELEATRAERAVELATAQADYDRAVAATRGPRSALRTVRRKVTEIEEQAQRQAREGRTSAKRTVESAQSALARRRAGYAEAAREVLRARPEEFSDATRASVESVESVVGRRARELDLWVRTLDAADTEVERKGQYLLAAAAALMLVLVLVLALR